LRRKSARHSLDAARRSEVSADQSHDESNQFSSLSSLVKGVPGVVVMDGDSELVALEKEDEVGGRPFLLSGAASSSYRGGARTCARR